MNSVKRRGILPAVITIALGLGLLGAAPSHADTDPDTPADVRTVSTSALPTVQTDGVVWDTTIIGDTVYAVGSFATARPAGALPGESTTPRANILAFKLSTGALITGFAPALNGEARVVVPSADKSKVYVGGAFTTVDGQPRAGFVSLDATTGAVDPNFHPDFSSTSGQKRSVRAIATAGSTVWVGGEFMIADGQPRTKIAAFDLGGSAPSLLPFAPTVEGGVVFGIVTNGTASTAPDRVVLAGSFVAVNGSSSPGWGLGMVDAGTGRALLPLPVNDVVRNAGQYASVTALKAYDDGSGFYGAAYNSQFLGGSLEGVFSAGWDGKLRWIEDCHGDTYDVQAIGEVMYSVSHKHHCDNLGTGGFPESGSTKYRATATTNYATGVSKPDAQGYLDHPGSPSPSLLTFFPDFNIGSKTGQGPWTVEGNDDYVVMGGEFTTVNSTAQEGLVRFGRTKNADGPRLTGSAMQLTATDVGAGNVTIRWTGNWDRDSSRLTYKLYRSATITGDPIETIEDSSPFWNLHSFRFVDKDRDRTKAPPYYRLTVEDPFGNTVSTASIRVVWADQDAGDPGFDAFTATSAPVITGSNTIGQTLSVASPATWSAPVPGATIPAPTYQWYREGVPVSGANGTSYTTSVLDTGRAITVVETVEDRRAIGAATSNVLTPGSASTGGPRPGPVDMNVPDPVVAGTPTVRTTVVASVGQYPSGVSLTRQWYRDGVPIAGATGSRYYVTPADAGRALAVAVTASGAGYKTSVRASQGRGVSAYNTSKPRLTGTVKKGKKLRATTKGSWVAPGYSFSYQWLRNGKAIKGATKSTYKLTKADRKKYVTFRVTAKKPGFATVTSSVTTKKVK